MRKALNKTGRKIIHSIKGSVSLADAPSVGEMRRSGHDIWMAWGTMLTLIDITINENLNFHTGPGFWNDLDMLEVGNPGMSLDEQIAHFSLWCAFKAPLLLGNNILTMDPKTHPEILSLLTHKGLIEINQDPLGESVRKVNYEDQKVEGGSAETLIVTDPCDRNKSNQIWTRTSNNKFIQLKSSETLVLTAKPNDFSSNDSYISVAPFKTDSDKSQWWHIDYKNNRILSLRNGGLTSNECLTISRYDNDYARLRQCDAKTRIYGNMWVTWETHLIFEHLDGNSFMIKNSKNKCLSVAALPELDVYAGRLSKNRIVVVLLNRDFKTHTMTVRWEHLTDVNINKEGAYNVLNVYNNTTKLNVKEFITEEVRPHYTVTLVLTPIRRTL